MKMLDICVLQKFFIDCQYFLYGFKKFGDFSIIEVNFLSQYGKILVGFELGELIFEIVDEIYFVVMLKGEEVVENLLEKVWLKYIKFVRGCKQFYILYSIVSNQLDYDDDYSDDEFDVV